MGVRGITRRHLVLGFPALLVAAGADTKRPKAPPPSGSFFRFADPVTETPVVRLTNPQFTSYLPAETNHFISVKDHFLVFSSDSAGPLAPFQLDLRTGTITQLAKPQALRAESLCLNRKRSSVYLLDSDALLEVSLTGNHKSSTIARGISSFCETGAVNGSPDFVLVRDGRLERFNASGTPIAKDVEDFCLLQPGGAGCVFLKRLNAEEREIWYAPLTGSAAPFLLTSGRVNNPVWSADGKSLFFLRRSDEGGVATAAIHAVSPQAATERIIAKTSQYAAFSPNADSSVFVGASASKAQPTVLLLLASVRREFTLCEHHSSHPASVSPVFSPDSRRVYFQSDHEGKSTLYSVNVEKLVESTDGLDL